MLLANNPELPQVACFDTAFHSGQSEVTHRYAIPERFYESGVRRFGFHGLSYEYVTGRMRALSADALNGKMIVAHLGSGASMCAIENGRSVASTMGFTALDGLPMGTRSGQLDPGAVLHLISHHGLSAAEVQTLLYKESGLLALSQISNDVRTLLTSPDPRAALALDYFTRQVGLYAGHLAAAMHGLDTFVFTAGIGEKSPEIRRRIAQELRWLGAELAQNSEDETEGLISSTHSRVAIFVVPTNEEAMIARHTCDLVFGRRNGGVIP